MEVLNGVRNVRAKQNLPKKDMLALYAPSVEAMPETCSDVIMKLGNLSSFSTETRPEGLGYTFLAKVHEYFIPAGDRIDIEAEKEKVQKELDYLKGFLISVDKKLGNERFVNNAPDAVVNGEKKKKADTEAKIESLQNRMTELG
tara:strand:+ start:82 stop:513 length:432 start_codon:yes stop_codon:yes gene_type:complete